MMRLRCVFLFYFLCWIGVMVAQQRQFTLSEQQQISIATPGLFARSLAFQIDFTVLRPEEYSFPLPVGKADIHGNDLEITTQKGDAVKAMFGGIVRLSRNIPGYGHVIVIRHDNGLETVYGHNAQNLVEVGQKVRAGQTIAIVGGAEGKVFCAFSIMVNGNKINPVTVVDVKSHKLRKQVLWFEKQGSLVSVCTSRESEDELSDDDKGNVEKSKRQAEITRLELNQLKNSDWAYPLPGSHVISPYGGARRHAGVDIKTRPRDRILAAFDGIVTQSGPYFGYGNFIVIKHDNGLETHYSHQSKNFVKKGDRVKAGQVIGLTGRTGRATTEHLHFEVLFHGRRIDPALVFDHVSKSLQQHTLVYSKGRVRKQ